MGHFLRLSFTASIILFSTLPATGADVAKGQKQETAVSSIEIQDLRARIDALELRVEELSVKFDRDTEAGSGAADPNSGAIAAAIDAFKGDECIQFDAIKNLEVITVRDNQEMCAKSGKLLGRFFEFSESKFYFKSPESGSMICDLESVCSFHALGEVKYVFERLGEDEVGKLALLRKVD